MSIKRKLQIVVEFLTNRKCEECKHNKGFLCDSPKGKKCVSNIFPIGYERKEKGGECDGKLL